jgi:hypothetical protein
MGAAAGLRRGEGVAELVGFGEHVVQAGSKLAAELMEHGDGDSWRLLACAKRSRVRTEIRRFGPRDYGFLRVWCVSGRG